MKTPSRFNSSMFAKLLFSGFAAAMLSAAVPALAQDQRPLPGSGAGRLHERGLAMEHHGDVKGAFVAFLDSAEQGYPPAQRKLGEIYDIGNSAVKRDYEESIRWYQKAREGGEEIPPPKTYGTLPLPAVRVGK